MIELFAPCVAIMDVNEDVPLQVALSLFVKSVIRSADSIFAARKDLTELVIQAVRILLRVPKDKSFESGSIYAGNLVILLFDRVLGKNHNEILQEIVLKVFRSRTPSVIQSLVLVYARLINQGVSQCNPLLTQRTSLPSARRSRPLPGELSTFFQPFPSRTGWDLRSSLTSGCCNRASSEASTPRPRRTSDPIQLHGPFPPVLAPRQAGR